MGAFFIALIVGAVLLIRIGYEKITIRANTKNTDKIEVKLPERPEFFPHIETDGKFYDHATRKQREEVMGELQIYPPYEVHLSQKEDCRYYFDEDQAMHILKPGECEVHEAYYGYRKKQMEAIDYKLLKSGILSREKAYAQLKECLRDIEYKRREYIQKQGGHANVVRR